MRNVYLYIGLFMLFGINCFGQDYNNHWQLGPSDIDFSTNPNTVNTIAGVADIDPYYKNIDTSISDGNGNLLFYFNGESVYNKNHVIMQNGFNVGHPSSHTRQGAIIVPHPANTNMYYIFYNVEEDISSGGGQEYSYYFYSIVDFTSNVLGEVLNFNTGPMLGFDSPKTKYLTLSTYVRAGTPNNLRPLTFTPNLTNTGYWIIIQEANRILSYELTSSGLTSTPVISTFAANTIYSGSPLHQGAMFRIVPQYNSVNSLKLYGLVFNVNNFYSLDFNNSTGTFSNYQQISLNPTSQISHFEVSPDFEKVYYLHGDQIFVKNLASLTTAPRLLYEFANSSVPTGLFHFLQKDKYGNVLVGSTSAINNKNKFIHKIENPNSFLTSSLNLNYVSLNGKTIKHFPQLIPSLNPGCISDITLSLPETNLNYVYQASNSVTTNNTYTVNSASSIEMKAGAYIVMMPNTYIQSGAVLLAKIENCPDAVAMKQSQVVSTSVETKTPKSGFFTMYPNPAHDRITLSSDAGMTSVTISSLDGLLMYSSKLSGKEPSHDVDVSRYTKGLYIINITTADGKTESQKLMKN